VLDKVPRAAHVEVLHANRPPGWATNAEVLDEVDDDESDDFANFNDEEDAPDVNKPQQAVVASFETARREPVTELGSSSWPRSGKLTTS
jgi:hypothetical protein